jgi:hypothetical protein
MAVAHGLLTDWTIVAFHDTDNAVRQSCRAFSGIENSLCLPSQRRVREGSVMRKTTIVILGVLCINAVGSADARSSRRAADYDGSWHLTFTTRTGPCDPSYDFDVNIAGGVITHPNLVRFHGNVASNGAARASVIVQDKSASGTGRLSLADGRGTWTGRSGSGKCSGYWTARKG